MSIAENKKLTQSKDQGSNEPEIEKTAKQQTAAEDQAVAVSGAGQ
jgi:hypothetical protein